MGCHFSKDTAYGGNAILPTGDHREDQGMVVQAVVGETEAGSNMLIEVNCHHRPT